MFLYSVSGLNLAVQNSETYQNVTTRENNPMVGNLLIDKCNVFVHSIILKNLWNLKRGAIKPVRLSKQTLSDQLGNGIYISTVKRILNELNVIHSDGFYNTQRLNPNKPPSSKSYVITDEWLSKGIAKVGVLDKRTIKKYRIWKTKQFNQLLTQRVHKRIMRNLSELYMDEEVAISAFNNLIPFDEDISTNDPKLRILHYASSFDTLCRLNTYESDKTMLKDDSFFYDKSKTNRIYHTYANVPSVYRESLRHKDGSSLIELDLKNSQPTMLLLYYITNNTKRPTYIEQRIKQAKERDNNRRYISGSFRPCNDRFMEEYPSLVKSILNGDLYEAVAEYALQKGDYESYNEYKTNRSDFKTDVLAKGLFNVLLDENKMHKIESYLLEMFPQFMNWIRAEKVIDGYESVAQLAQRLEASIFIDGIFDLDTGYEQFGFAVPIHDSLIVKEDEEAYWRTVLYSAFLAVFPLPHILDKRLDEMIKTKKYNG
jgi:hypothetical protein